MKSNQSHTKEYVDKKQNSGAWEEEFDRLFVDENIWQGEDEYTKNVPIGNIKNFISSVRHQAQLEILERVEKVLADSVSFYDWDLLDNIRKDIK